MTKILRPKTDPGVVPPPAPGSPEPTAPASRAPRPLVPPRAPSSAKTRGKVLLSVLDGKIEWDKMTAESRKAFEEMFRDPEFLKQFGLSGKKQFDPEQMKAIYDGMSMIYQTVCAFLLKWPPQILAMLAYSDEQKEMLAKPTAALADQFAPRLLREHQNLIVWGSIFGAVTQKNFLAALTEVKKIEAQKAARFPPPPGSPGPVRVPGPPPADRPAPTFTVPFAPPPMEEGASLG